MNRTCSATRRDFLKGTLAAGAIGLVPGAALGEQPKETKPHDEPHKIGIYTRPWSAHDYRVALDAIAEAGFVYAGMMTTTVPWGRLVISTSTTLEQAEQVGAEARKRGLQIPSVYGGGIPVQQSLEAGIAGMRKLIDNCVAAKAASLLMGGIGKADLYDRYYKAIAECCDYAAERGIAITVKPHGGLNATGPQCRKCVEGVGHKNFSLWYDPGNIYFYSNGELDPVDDAATVDGLVTVGMCIKDFDMTDKNGKPTRDVMVTPGDGRVDFVGVLRKLRAGGFTRGHLVIECLNQRDGSLPAILAEAKRARQFVQQVVTRMIAD
jgi:sugar phosphate isomerase/epimerase